MSEFKMNGGFCCICDANHSTRVHPDGKEICESCWQKCQGRMVAERRN